MNMTMTDWAEREIAAACKRENPNWDGKSFDYGCSCYQSALKAYKSLIDDGHSGFSFGVTRNRLIEESIGLKGLIEVVDNVKEEIKDLINKKFN